MPLYPSIPARAPLLRGCRGMNATNHYDLAGGSDLDGNGTGFEIFVAFVLDESPPIYAANQYVLSAGEVFVGGYQLGFSRTGFQAFISDSGGTPFGLNAGKFFTDGGKMLGVLGIAYDGANVIYRGMGGVIRTYALASFGADASGVRIGSQANGSNPVVDPVTLVAIGAKTDGVLTTAQWEEQVRSLLTTGDFSDNNLTSRYSFQTIDVGAAPATLIDQIGSNDFTLTGSLDVVNEHPAGQSVWGRSIGALASLDTVGAAQITDDAVTLAKLAPGTAGNLITYDAAGEPAAVATGTATQVLTSNGAGLAPTFQAAGGGGTTTANIDLYVDGTTGNDANPGTALLPLATIGAAIDLVPPFLLHRVVIHIVAAGSYTCPSISKFVFCGGSLMVYATPVTELVASTSALGGSTANAVVSSGLGVDAYRGAFIEILAGPGAGDRRMVRDNSATVITPCATFTAAITVASTYRIITPSVTITLDGTEIFRGGTPHKSGLAQYTPGFTFANVRFAAVAGVARYTIDREVVFLGCVEESSGRITCAVASRAVLGLDAIGPTAARAPYDAGLTTSDESWVGYGFSSLSATGVGPDVTYDSAVITGYLVAVRLQAGLGESVLLGGNLYGSGVSIPGIRANGIGVTVNIESYTPTLLVTSASTLGALYADKGGSINANDGAYIATGAGSAAAMSDRGGEIIVRSVTPSGSGESFGVRSRRGGRVVLTEASTAMTYSGAADDARGAIAVGESPSIALGTCLNLGTGLSTDGAFLAVADGATVQRAQ